MKKVLTLAIAMAPSLFFAQITAPEPAVAQKVEAVKPSLTTIELDKTTHDFGTINEGDIVKTTYVITNTGTEPLILSKPKVSCGCTTPTYPKELIQPGESGEILVQFDSTGKPNKQFKRVKLTGNFEESTLTFTVFVTPKAVEKEVEKLEEAEEKAENAQEKPERKAEKMQDKMVKEQEKAEKASEKAQKEAEKAQSKTEKELKKAEKARKKLQSQQKKVTSLEDKVNDAEKKLAKEKKKFVAKQEAGKIAPLDATKWEEKYTQKQLAIEKMKAKLKKETTKLSRLK